MDGGDWLRLILALFCVGVVAFTTTILIGYASTSRTRIAELATQGNRRARDVDDLLEWYHHLQATMMLLDTAAVGFAVSLVTAEVVGHLPGWGVALIVFTTVVVVIVFGRAVPRGIAMMIPEQAALRF